MSPGPNIWTLNIQPLSQFRPHLGFSVRLIHFERNRAHGTLTAPEKAA
jgi:hypothetical protein